MTYVRLAGLRHVDSIYAGHPAVRWQTKLSPPDMIAVVVDTNPGSDWIILGNPHHCRVTLQRLVFDDDPERSEWSTVDDAIGHALGDVR